ncbi:MAG: alanyl-tRNA editing protein [Alphaproteobacteria bacterium]
MPTQRLYLENDALSGTATITALIDGDTPIVRLNQTLFHAQGGGQKADRGTIGPVTVAHVAHNGDEADHIVDTLDGLSVGDEVEINVDADWRQLNTAYHSAGHLLAAVAEELAPTLIAVSGHQWPGEARVEFTFGGELPDIAALVPALNERLAALINDDVPVAITGDPYSDRAMKVGDYQAIPCGGTHVASLAQIGTVTIEGAKRKKDKLRIKYSVQV